MAKICTICGVDCSAIPRTKDRRGRYFCTPCYEQAAKARTAPETAADDDGGFDLVAAAIAESMPADATAPSPGRACVACGAALAADAVVCTQCGARPGLAPALVTHTGDRGSAGADGANWSLWPYYLYCRPAVFFRAFAATSSPLLIAVFAWMLGIAGTIDRVQVRTAMAQGAGRPPALPDVWGVHWAVYLVGGALAGALYAGIGGWWYRVRIGWAGAADPDRTLARRVYLLASQVTAIPAIIYAAVQTATYPTPGAAFGSPISIGDILIFVCLFWSIWTSYMGVRTVFDTGKVRAIIWFVALPAVAYVVTIAGGMILTAVMMAASSGGAPGGPSGAAFSPGAPPAGIAAAPEDSDAPGAERFGFPDEMRPDIDAPARYARAGLEFAYPGNWTLEEPQAGAIVLRDRRTASVTVLTYTGSSVDEILEGCVGYVYEQLDRPTDGGSFTRYGRFTGRGRVVRGVVGNLEFTDRWFAASVGRGRIFVVGVSCATDDLPPVSPGLELVEQTLNVR